MAVHGPDRQSHDIGEFSDCGRVAVDGDLVPQRPKGSPFRADRHFDTPRSPRPFTVPRYSNASSTELSTAPGLAEVELLRITTISATNVRSTPCAPRGCRWSGSRRCGGAAPPTSQGPGRPTTSARSLPAPLGKFKTTDRPVLPDARRFAWFRRIRGKIRYSL